MVLFGIDQQMIKRSNKFVQGLYSRYLFRWDVKECVRLPVEFVIIGI